MALRYEDIKPEMIRSIASSFPALRAILLFGSFARGEITRKSDVDLLLVFDNRKEAKKAEKKVLKIVGKYAGEEKRTVVPVCIGVENLVSEVEFFYNVFSDALVLYKRPDNEPVLPAGASGFSPMLLYSFDLSNLARTKKMEINRSLYGITFKKERKEYAYKGLLERKGGQKLGSGIIMVPSYAEKEFDEFFKKYSVSLEKRAVVLLSF
ncbi:MAG: nucleotidyltransferase domain-containing protein [Euryarchaeota archaeon]|nr:nucleotidyltransferase domain-containing protein [Euryarchaeota archaeon]